MQFIGRVATLSNECIIVINNMDDSLIQMDTEQQEIIIDNDDLEKDNLKEENEMLKQEIMNINKN